MGLLQDRKVLVGVAGGIAAYKTPELVRALGKEGADVRVVTTENARRFVAPLALQVVSGAAVGTDLFDPRYEAEIGHIELARWCEVVLLAPATANGVAKLAHGLADDLLSTVLLATTAPLVISPAMNTQMLQHPMVQSNLSRLGSLLGAHVVQPDEGELACKEVGPGRMPDPDVLIDAIGRALGPQPLLGRRVLVTVGPTRERLDPVRFLSNPSSGRMGYQLARVAHYLGAQVVAVAGPTTARRPWAVEHVPVESAEEMRAAVIGKLELGIDIAVFAAAVADRRPQSQNDRKLAKRELPEALSLTPTPDILAEVAARRERPFCVGFAAETHDMEQHAVEKCRRKGCDLIVGNDVSGGGVFGQGENEVVIADGEAVRARFGPAAKAQIARDIWRVVVEAYESAAG